MLCHGQGNRDSDGCCWVDGAPCPLRWKITDGRVYDATGADLGTPTQAAGRIATGQARGRVVAQLTGPAIVCRAALEVIASAATMLTNRPALNAAWNSHPEYVAKVRPEWARIEGELGLAPGSYQCSTWRGIAGGECCFAEDAATNAAKEGTLTTEAVTVRRAGGL